MLTDWHWRWDIMWILLWELTAIRARLTLTTQRVDERGCERWVWGHRDCHWSNSKEMLHVLYVAAATQTETCPWDKNMMARQREITSSSRYPASCLPMPPPPHPPRSCVTNSHSSPGPSGKRSPCTWCLGSASCLELLFAGLSSSRQKIRYPVFLIHLWFPAPGMVPGAEQRSGK